MTEITTYQPAQAPAPAVTIAPTTVQATQGTVDLIAWANELSAAHQIATAISNTDFVPKEFKGSPDKTATAILYGKSLGLDPLASLTNIFVVHGKPAIYSRTMVALAQRAGVEFARTIATEQQVTVNARRRGGDWQEFTWTIQRADKAGYTSNAKYRTDPIGMLTAKAFTEAVRVLAPDVLMGIAVSEEVELGDYDEAPAAIDVPKPVTPAAGARQVQRKRPTQAQAQAPVSSPAEPAPADPPAQEPAPESVDTATGEVAPEQTPAEPAQAEAEAAEVKTISKMNQGKVSKALDALGYTDRAKKLEYVRWAFQLPELPSVAALTVEQGKNLLNHLEQELAKSQQAPAS